MTAPLTAGDLITDERRQQIELLLGEGEREEDAARFRREHTRQLEPLQRQYRAGILRSQPNDLAATEFLTRCETAIESWLAWRIWRGARATASASPRFTGNPFPRLRTCGHETDRRCLCCRRRFCARCQPGSGGARCRKCNGPVWRDEEELCPPRRNPALRGHNR